MAIDVPVLNVTVTDANSVSAHTFSVSAPGIAAGNHALVAGIEPGGRTLSSVTDSKGNTWQVDETLANTTNHGGGIATSKLATALAAGDTVTLTFSGTGTFAGMLLDLGDGLDGTTWTDISVSQANASSTTLDSSTGATSDTADELQIGVGMHAGTSDLTPETLSPAWTNLNNQQTPTFARTIRLYYRIVSGTEAQRFNGTLAAAQINTGFFVTYRAGGAGAQNVGMNHLAGTVLNNPTVVPGAVTVALQHIAGTLLFQPTVSLGGQIVGMNHLAGTSLFGPTVVPGAVIVAMNHLAGSALFSPTVAPGVAIVGLQHIAGTSLFGPTVAPGAVVVGMNHLAGSALFGPNVAGAQVVAMNHLAGTLVNNHVVSLAAALAHVRPVAVEYVVELFNSGATFGPGTKVGEVWDARNLGWSRYDRMPGKAFMTLAQTSSSLALITPLLTHFKVWRISAAATRNVYSGVLIDPDSANDDVVWTGYDYIALLSLSRSGFKTLYPTKLLGSEIVSPEWTLAKNATSSILGFVTTGTIENPLGTDGVTTIKSNAQFGTLMQQRLQLIYDLSEMGRANTVNHVTFEITTTAPHTFNFWKNKGVDSGAAFVLNGNVRGYRYLPRWMTYRNDLASVGVSTSGGPSAITKTDTTGITAKGLRQDVFSARTLLGLSGAATEADQQQAALAQQLVRSLQLQPALQLDLLRGGHDPGSVPIADKVRLEVGNGQDSITGLWRLLGERVIFSDEGEEAAVFVGPLAA